MVRKLLGGLAVLALMCGLVDAVCEDAYCEAVKMPPQNEIMQILLSFAGLQDFAYKSNLPAILGNKKIVPAKLPVIIGAMISDYITNHLGKEWQIASKQQSDNVALGRLGSLYSLIARALLRNYPEAAASIPIIFGSGIFLGD